MQLTLKNNQLLILAMILDKVHPHSMRANRGRAKLFGKVQSKLVEYHKDEADILKDYCELDEAGQFVRLEDGGLSLKDPGNIAEVHDLQTELANEQVVIKAGEYANRYKDFLDWLAESEDDFTTEEVIVIDDFLEQYESSKGDKDV